MAEEIRVASTSDIAPGTAKVVEAGGKEIALFNVDGEIHATTNVCPHQGGPLAEGMLDGTQVVCPWHAWAFDVRDGTSPANPRAKIDTYPVRVEGDDIILTI